MARSTAKKTSKAAPIPTHGVPITDPAFVPEYDEEGIIKNDPDSPYNVDLTRAWKRRGVPTRKAGLVLPRTWVGLTQVDVAKQLDVTQAEVSRIENAGDTLQLSTLRAYAEALGYELEVCFTKDGLRRRVM